MADLDKDQQYAVDYEDSLAVIAGPGSGKTRVLTSKAIKEFRENKDILCLTFTRAAAAEMRSRQVGLPACTIHSYCCGIVGWKDQWGYDGLLSRMLWEKDKKRFDTVLLDECQDVNELELDVVLSLVGDRLFVVGDPYQSIYGFQGAMGYSVINRLNALGIKSFNLTNTYRNSKGIVSKLETIYKRDLISRNTIDNGLTAILFRRNTDLFFVSDELKKEGIPHQVRLAVNRSESEDKREYDVIEESNLRLMTIHSSKGLEFSRVIVFDWYPGTIGEETRVLYVAMSRASKDFRLAGTMGELKGILSEGSKRRAQV